MSKRITVWPVTIRVRDTKRNDDLGGLGQRIFTTAGAGYKKKEYILKEKYDQLQAENERLRKALQDLVDLKDMKDTLGKIPEYTENQPKAWARARLALKDTATCEHGKGLTDYCESCGRIHGSG